MKKTILLILILGLFFFIFTNFSFAACQTPDISEYKNCQTGCGGISNLIEKSNCSNTCIGNWSKTQDRYRKCLEDEQKQAEQKKLEEQKEQKTVSWISSAVKFFQGEAEFVKDGKISEVVSGLEVNAGGVIRTGEGSTVELASEDGIVRLGENTTIGFISFESEPPRIAYPDTPEGILDPKYKLEFDDAVFWSKTAADLADFIKENRPDYIFSCAKGDFYSCVWDSATFVYNGVAWFDKKIKEDFPKHAIVTPTAAITTMGTEFIVEVAADGVTTVTTLEGALFVTDLISRKTAIVDSNQKIKVPKTPAGLGEQELQRSLTMIEPGSIDRWWIKEAEVPKSKTFLTLSIILLIIVAGITVFLKYR